MGLYPVKAVHAKYHKLSEVSVKSISYSNSANLYSLSLSLSKVRVPTHPRAHWYNVCSQLCYIRIYCLFYFGMSTSTNSSSTNVISQLYYSVWAFRESITTEDKTSYWLHQMSTLLEATCAYSLHVIPPLTHLLSVWSATLVSVNEHATYHHCISQLHYMTYQDTPGLVCKRRFPDRSP